MWTGLFPGAGRAFPVCLIVDNIERLVVVKLENE
jgi:hypothetical protein